MSILLNEVCTCQLKPSLSGRGYSSACAAHWAASLSSGALNETTNGGRYLQQELHEGPEADSQRALAGPVDDGLEQLAQQAQVAAGGRVQLLRVPPGLP